MQAQAQGPLMNRLMGIVTFKAPVYKEIAEDKTATQMAAIIVIVVAVIVGLISGLFAGRGFIIVLLTALLGQIVGWLIGSWLLAFIAKTFFQGDTDTGEMLRVTGFTAIFRILGIIPVIGGLIGGILQIIANIIAIREAAGFDTTKAILTAIIAGVIVFVVIAVIGLILGVIFVGATAISNQ
jgi:hypothetical protein